MADTKRKELEWKRGGKWRKKSGVEGQKLAGIQVIRRLCQSVNEKVGIGFLSLPEAKFWPFLEETP